jgi:hypothetical protein
MAPIRMALALRAGTALPSLAWTEERAETALSFSPGFITVRGDRQMPARMTPTAWGRGATNALICGFILLVSWLLIAGLISSFSHTSLTDSFSLAWTFLAGLILVLFLGTWLYGLNAGGRVLLDCGPHPTRVLFLIEAAVFPALGFCGGFAASSLSRSLAISGPMFGISVGVYSLIMASGRLQIREGGLWQYWGLLLWERIVSCELSGDSTLMVQAKTRLPLLGRGALPVPREQKQAINELLQKHCSAFR